MHPREQPDQSRTPISRDAIARCLLRVGQILNEAGETGELLLVGGAYMTLVLRQRETTRDVDAYFATHADAIRAAAAVVGQEEHLPADWLNDAVKGFLYTQPGMSLWLEVPGLRIYAPDASYIFAMKAVAGRPEDIRDLRALRDIIGFTSVDEALAVVTRYVPDRLLAPRVRYLIEDLFDADA